jgi:hypothetical protein
LSLFRARGAIFPAPRPDSTHSASELSFARCPVRVAALRRDRNGSARLRQENVGFQAGDHRRCADGVERRYGFWRGLLDGVVARYLDCGIFERGFARLRCPDCAAEFLLAFSCKGRGLCPSCGAKRAAEFAAFLKDEVVADVGHAQWVFTVPKLLRPYFMHHRVGAQWELPGGCDA